MSELDLEKMTKIQLQTLNEKKAILTSRRYNGLGIEQLLMIPISDEQEIIVDRLYNGLSNSITIENYTLSKNNTIAYGHVNLEENSRDFLSLETLKLHNFDIDKGIKIPNNYDYKNHCCYVEKGKRPNYLNSPTLQMDGIDWIKCKNIAKVIQYNHGMLGKPNKVVIFTNFIYNKK